MCSSPLHAPFTMLLPSLNADSKSRPSESGTKISNLNRNRLIFELWILYIILEMWASQLQTLIIIVCVCMTVCLSINSSAATKTYDIRKVITSVFLLEVLYPNTLYPFWMLPEFIVELTKLCHQWLTDDAQKPVSFGITSNNKRNHRSHVRLPNITLHSLNVLRHPAILLTLLHPTLEKFKLEVLISKMGAFFQQRMSGIWGMITFKRWARYWARFVPTYARTDL